VHVRQNFTILSLNLGRLASGRMIPRVAHFVFGLQEQTEPLHFLHYASLESCRRTLQPERIYFHHKHLPWGPWWERIRPHLTLAEVDLAPEVLAADYSPGHVPDKYRYAHHSDFIRLDALLAHGGIYADIDTIFVRPFPEELFAAPFVIGREPAVVDERSGNARPSLCNALLMSEPGAEFARAWRERMAHELNGTWSNHSGFLSAELSRELPAAVRVEPEMTFFPFPATVAGLSMLLEQRHPLPPGALSVHLWAHLWWERDRWDFSQAHAGRYIASYVRQARTTLADLTRPCLPAPAPPPRSRAAAATPAATWRYLSLDEDSGYGVAAMRCLAALEQAGVPVAWTPFAPGPSWGYPHEPVPGADLGDETVVVAHLVAEYLPMVRARRPDAFLVAHTVWDTDRIPDHWIECLDAADLVVVPSRFSADAMAAIKPPVAIVPHIAPAVAPSTAAPPAPAAAPEIPDDVVVFYTIAEWNERKAPFLTIEAYLQAFTGRDRVLLLVKTSHWDRRASAGDHRLSQAAGPGTTAWSVARLLAAHPDPPAIRLITRSLTDREIAAIHGRGDCYVSLARGEGWGLGAFDAAAAGNPVITTGYGGQLDYLGDSPQLVRFDLVPVDDPTGFPSYAPYQRWAEPDVDHATALIRRFASNPRAASVEAQELGARIQRQYAPEAIADSWRGAIAGRAAEKRNQTPTTPSRRR
jgi:glycosyltransferase involved in cell wall biosynthesis